MMEEKEAEAQQVLDALLAEGLIPFKLSVGSLQGTGSGEYDVRFHDSRIRSVEFSCSEAESFPEVFRAAVLDRVSRMTGPLRR